MENGHPSRRLEASDGSSAEESNDGQSDSPEPAMNVRDRGDGGEELFGGAVGNSRPRGQEPPVAVNRVEHLMVDEEVGIDAGLEPNRLARMARAVLLQQNLIQNDMDEDEVIIRQLGRPASPEADIEPDEPEDEVIIRQPGRPASPEADIEPDEPEGVPEDEVVIRQPGRPVSPGADVEPDEPEDEVIIRQPGQPASPEEDMEPDQLEEPEDEVIIRQPGRPISPGADVEPEQPEDEVILRQPGRPASPGADVEPEQPEDEVILRQPGRPVSPGVDGEPDQPDGMGGYEVILRERQPGRPARPGMIVEPDEPEDEVNIRESAPVGGEDYPPLDEPIVVPRESEFDRRLRVVRQALNDVNVGQPGMPVENRLIRVVEIGLHQEEPIDLLGELVPQPEAMIMEQEDSNDEASAACRQEASAAEGSPESAMCVDDPVEEAAARGPRELPRMDFEEIRRRVLAGPPNPPLEDDIPRVLRALLGEGGDQRERVAVVEQWVAVGRMAIAHLRQGVDALEAAAANFRQAMDAVEGLRDEQRDDGGDGPAADPA